MGMGWEKDTGKMAEKVILVENTVLKCVMHETLYIAVRQTTAPKYMCVYTYTYTHIHIIAIGGGK